MCSLNSNQPNKSKPHELSALAAQHVIRMNICTPRHILAWTDFPAHPKRVTRIVWPYANCFSWLE